jgi:protein-tyrosine phosphatase
LIDLHSHVLPGLDDGPERLDESVALARAAQAAGTTVLVATPHFNRRWQPTAATSAAAALELREALAAAGVTLELRLGAEVAMPEALRLDDETLRELHLGDGPWLLLECPLEPAGMELERAVEALMERGHEILLAHPERSPSLRDRPARLRALVERGARCSITAAALEGRFGPAAGWSALELLRAGLVHSIDSDAHHATGRPPGLEGGVRAALERLPALAGTMRRLTTDIPAAILAGEPLPAATD